MEDFDFNELEAEMRHDSQRRLRALALLLDVGTLAVELDIDRLTTETKVLLDEAKILIKENVV